MFLVFRIELDEDSDVDDSIQVVKVIPARKRVKIPNKKTEPEVIVWAFLFFRFWIDCNIYFCCRFWIQAQRKKRKSKIKVSASVRFVLSV